MLENNIVVTGAAASVQSNSSNINAAGQQLAHTPATPPSVNPDTPKSWGPDLRELQLLT